MAAIRVTIGDMPALLRSLVEGMLGEDPRFEVVSGDGLRPAERAVPQPDVLVISEDAMKRIVPVSAMAHGRRGLGVVAIAPNGLDATVVRLSAYHRSLDREPRLTLSEAIRDAAGAAPGLG